MNSVLKLIKNGIYIMSCTLLIFSITFTAAFAESIKIDGTTGNLEWNNFPLISIISTDDISNCDVTYADMRAFVDKKDPALFLCFIVMLKDFTKESAPPAVKITINNQNSIIIKYNVEKKTEDSNIYSLVSQCEPISNGFFMEMRIGLKYGLPQKMTLGIQFIDVLGQYSNYYEKLIYNTTVPETQKNETKTTVKHAIPTTHHAVEASAKQSNTSGYINTVSPNSSGASVSSNGTPGNSQEPSQQNTTLPAEQTADDSAKETSKAAVNTQTTNRTKQIAAISLAVLLIIAAVCICIYAGLPKNKRKPQPGQEKPPADDIDDDY